MSRNNIQLYRDDVNKEKQAQLADTTQRTKDALNKLLSKKLHDDKVTTLSSSATNDGSSYIRYTSSQISNFNSTDNPNAPKQRIIKITDERVDPMLPSSFKIRKTPAGPQSNGIVPVLHDDSTSDKLTKEDQKKWQIAPAVSNWKNTKGFIIGIDNRLENTGNTKLMTQADIEKSTKNFTALSDALKNAERQAKQDLRARASWRKRKEDKEITQTKERLNKLAQEATSSNNIENLLLKNENQTELSSSKLERRAERRRMVEEELKQSKNSTKDKIRKLANEQGREVSDRVILGVSEAMKKKQKINVYDSDLFLKSTTPKTADADGDKVYDTPLFEQDSALHDIYRTRNISRYQGLGSKGSTENTSASVTFVKDSDHKS